MKSRVLLLVFLLIGSIIGYFIFSRIDRGNAAVNEVIPETSALVFQLDDPRAQLASLQSFEWSDRLDDIPLLSKLELNLGLLDSLEANQVIKSKLSNLNTWISLHTTARDELTPLYVVQSANFDWNIESLKTILDFFVDEDISLNKQLFNGNEITLFQVEGFNISVLIQGDFLVFSESTVLVEDVIRAIQNPDSRLLNGEMDANIGSDLKVIINGSRLNELRSVFFQPQRFNSQRKVANGNFLIELTFNEQGISFNGSGEKLPEIEKKLAAAIFAQNFIPLSANSFSWRPADISAEAWSQMLEPALCELEIDGNGRPSNRVLVFSVKDTSQLSGHLKGLAESNLMPGDSSIYQERFINSNVGFVNDAELLNKILPGYADVSVPQFYTVIQDLLILSGDVEALKTVLSDFDEETTWGRSVEKRPLISDLIQETDFTYLQDFEYARDPLKNKLRDTWSAFFESKPQLLDALDLFTLQLNRTSNDLLVSGQLSFTENYNSPVQISTSELELNVKANVFAESDLATKPYVVKNHVDASFEVAFQDGSNQLYLANKQGEVLWQKTLSGSIKGDIHQVDYYNNKKLQYMAFTDSLIYLIDRNGDDVNGFPRSFQSSLPVTGSEVIDYNNDKRYRYLSTDRRGNLSLFDKSGEILEGWDPRVIGGSLLQTPFHVRVRGRDCFVAVESQGKIHLLNRRGQEYPGFPIEMGKSLRGDISFLAGSNFSQSLISVATGDGELIQVNMEGNVVLRKQLLRGSANSEFQLINDALESTFSVVRNDGKVLSFFNSEGIERFSLDYLNSKSLKFDQYNFRNGKEIFVVRDLKEQSVRLINKDGEFLTPKIPSSEQVGILYYQNRLEYEVFVNFANQLNVYAVKPL